MPTVQISRISTITLIIGTALSVGVGIASYFLPATSPVFVAFLITLIGIQATLTLDHRVKLSEIQTGLAASDAEQAIRTRIAELAKRDPTFQKKYEEVRSELAELASGKYRIRSSTSVYVDDRESIDRLNRGETLLSTCPVPPAGLDKAVEQITDSNYIASMDAHKAAARRGVEVIRIYLLENRAYFSHEPIKKHLLEMQNSGVDARVIFRDRTNIEGETDFLVFGKRKVSIGVAEPGAGIVSGAIVDTDFAIIQSYIDKYVQLKAVSLKPDVIP